MKKPRILVIENAVALTEGLESIARSSKGLKETYEFTFVVPQGSLAKNYLTSLDFEVYELPMVEIRKDIFTAISYLPILLINTIRLFGLVNRLKASLIVSNDLYNLMPPLFKFFGGKRPYVVYVRFLPSKFPKILMAFWCFWNKAYSFATIVVSHAVKNELSYHRGVVCIGGELPAQNFPYAPPASKRILYPANYIRGKGHEYALQSWAMI